MSITGPLNPLCVISIGPFSVYFFLFIVSLIWTSKVIPEQDFNDFSSVEKEKRDGTGWTIECPRLFASLRPLGWPPVQISIFFAWKYLFPLTNKLNPSFIILFPNPTPKRPPLPKALTAFSVWILSLPLIQ